MVGHGGVGSLKAVAMDSASAKEAAHVQPKRWKRLFARSMSEPCT